MAGDRSVICAGFADLLDAQPDLALVDVGMPVIDGIEATGIIIRRFPTRVLILTTVDLDEQVFDAIKAGASGFLLKEVTAERLVDGVRLVTEGPMLMMLARGLSYAAIAGELVIGVETVKSHVGEILRKLRLRDRIHAVVFAYENGLVVPR